MFFANINVHVKIRKHLHKHKETHGTSVCMSVQNDMEIRYARQIIEFNYIN